MATAVASPLLVCLSLVLLPTIQSCPHTCVSGFLGREGVESYFNTNPNVHLENYQGVLRLMPALNFTCDTTITSIRVGGRRMFGYGTPQVQIWRQDATILVHTVHLRDVATTEHPGVYEKILTEPIPVKEGDTVAANEPLYSRLRLFNEVDAGIYPHTVFIDSIPPQPLTGYDAHPLLTIETRDNECTAGFRTSSDLARKSLSSALSTNFNYLCVVPDIHVQFPRDGLLSKLSYVGQYIQSRVSDNMLYPSKFSSFVWQISSIEIGHFGS